jgi:uncharacterized OsmC-like protein
MATITFRAADEPQKFVGSADGYEVVVDRGEIGKPRSVELFLLGLGSCTISTINHYLKRKDLPTEGLSVEVSSDLIESENRYGDIRIKVSLHDSIPENVCKVVQGVARSCRVHRTIMAQPEIEITVVNEREMTAA